MIVSVVGKVDGQDVVFKHIGNNKWAVDVPPDFTDYTRIVEIVATDEAGNKSFMTFEELLLDTTEFCLKKQPEKYNLRIMK